MFAVAAYLIALGQVLDQFRHARADLVGEVRRRGADEGVDLVDRRASHGGSVTRVAAVRRPSAAESLLLLTVSIWAFNFTVTRYVLTHGFQPLAYASWRYVGAAAIFGVLTYAIEGSLRVSRRDLPLLLAAAAFLTVNQFTFHYGLKLTTASAGALIMGTLPIFTALIAAATRVERLTPRFAAAGMVSFGGVALVAAGSESGGGGSTSGNLLIVGTAASWAAYSVAIAPLMQRYSPYRISSFVLAVVCIPLLVTGAEQISSQDWSLGTTVWAAAVFAILGPIVLTNVLWFRAIAQVGPSRATLVANLQPFLAAVFALVILSEEMTWVQIVGGVAIAAGIALVRRRRPPQAPPSE